MPARINRWSDLKPRFDSSRDRWEILVPAHLAGKKNRYRPTFPSRDEADKWLSDRITAQSTGQKITLGKTDSSGLLLLELVRLFLTDKKGKLAPESHRMLSHRLGKAVERFGHIEAGSLNPWQVKQWLEGLQCSQRTRYGIFSECRGLFRWAMRYDLATTNPFDRMEPEGKGLASKAILTPDQMRELLAIELPVWMRTWLVLGGFAGLRSVEVFRLDWSAVDRRGRQVWVGRDVIKKTKGLRHRHVDLLPACLRHLPPRQKGPIVPVVENSVIYWRQKMAEAIGFKRWPQNALRHSFASYHLAAFQDAAKTALQLGHTSPQTTFSNYAETVPRSAARAWWKL